jgi:hypothetical protein
MSAASIVNIYRAVFSLSFCVNTGDEKQRPRALWPSLVSCRLSVLFAEKRNGTCLFIFGWLWGYVARALEAALSSIMAFYLIPYYVDSTSTHFSILTFTRDRYSRPIHGRSAAWTSYMDSTSHYPKLKKKIKLFFIFYLLTWS